MKRIILTILAVFSLSMVGSTIATVSVTHADAKSQITDSLNNVNDGNTTDLSGGITGIINMLLFIIGAVAVVVIIIGGIKYVISNGDSGAVQSAKSTIMYAVIGLLVAILAYAVVNFVVTQFMD